MQAAGVRAGVVRAGRWVALGVVVGVLAGLSSATFLATLAWATDTRLAHPWLLWPLPAAGFAVGWAYHRFGADAVEGNNLILDEVHTPRRWVPRRMAPLTYVATVATQLFGGSAGREGTALQLAGSLTDGWARLVRLPPVERRVLLVAALSGGFGAVFGVPLAGIAFGLEVQRIGRLRLTAALPCAVASVVGDAVVRALGVGHEHAPPLPHVGLSPGVVARVAVAGAAFALAATAFSRLTHGVGRALAATGLWPPLRPALGGAAVVALTLAVGDGRPYNGLSLPLAAAALAGAGVPALAFAWKGLFTAVTLGSGFQGGEVTPLFVIGAALGSALAPVVGLDPQVGAALGFVGVFAGAANVPVACTVMGVELFGWGGAALFAVACGVSFALSAHPGIYRTQHLSLPKARHVAARLRRGGRPSWPPRRGGARPRR